jgi:hypothetical protein
VWTSDLPGTHPQPTLQAVIDEIIALNMSVPYPRRCSVTLNSINYDVTGTSYVFAPEPGNEAGHYHQLNFTLVRDNAASCDVTESRTYFVLGQRQFACPVVHTAVFQNSPRVGPHCAMPWWKPDERKSAGCGDCQSGQVKKGNSIDVGTGNKYQHETDYVGAGHRPLRIDRHYNSLLIKNYSPTAFDADVFGPGWSAQYFQRIKYFSVGTTSTAQAYRPDGQVLLFNLSGTDFVGAPDIVEKVKSST